VCRAWRVRFPCASAVPLLLALACRGDTPDQAAGAPRDRLRQPERILAALALAPGQRVADVGAGSGYLTFRLADAVGASGRVVATDIDEGALAALRAHRPARANVVVRQVAPDDPGLEPASFDLVLLSEVDHYLPDRVVYLRKLRAALAPGGRIAVTNRRSFRALLIAAAERAGYAVAGEARDLPAHFLVFLRPARP
jgi:SAM-dependent methyltransferase